MDIKTQKQDLLRIKKFLSFVLRHKPFLYKIKLDMEGFASVDELLNVLKSHQQIEITKEEFVYVAKDLSGGIFKFNKDKSKMSARYGHTFIYNLNIPAGFEEVEALPHDLYFIINSNDLTPLLSTEFIPASNKSIKLYKSSPNNNQKLACCKLNGQRINLKTHKFYYSKTEDCYFTKIIPLASVSLNV